SESEKSELRKIFGKFFDDGIINAELGNYDSISQMVSAFGALVEGSFQFSGNLGDGLESITSMIGAASQLTKIIGSFSGNSMISSMSGPLAAFAAFGGVISFVTSFFAQKR